MSTSFYNGAWKPQMKVWTAWYMFSFICMCFIYMNELPPVPTFLIPYSIHSWTIKLWLRGLLSLDWPLHFRYYIGSEKGAVLYQIRSVSGPIWKPDYCQNMQYETRWSRGHDLTGQPSWMFSPSIKTIKAINNENNKLIKTAIKFFPMEGMFTSDSEVLRWWLYHCLPFHTGMVSDPLSPLVTVNII